MTYHQQEIQLILLVHLLRPLQVTSRTWGQMYMDQREDCDRVLTRNQDLIEGDLFLVKSDVYGGKAPSQRQPAECSVAFNLGGRRPAVAVVDWTCDDQYREPLLAIYAECDTTRRTQPLAWLNCTSPRPSADIESTTSCISVYHHRGHRNGGYFFALQIIAGYELIAFPAGGITAIVIATVVMVMIVAKVICVITGYEHRLPNIDFDDDNDDDEQNKQIVLDHQSTDAGTSAITESTCNNAALDLNNQDEIISATTRTDGLSNSSHVIVSVQSVTDNESVRTHPNLHVTRSNGSTAAAAADLADLDLDFLDLPVDGTPRLKRYPSARASSIWRHK